ncbi:MAG: GGDEF domain-containing protein [Lachnospiraceae bacterium]|nr:GGDEF domain-containing protein [Lachnospiraceae bacterium]
MVTKEMDKKDFYQSKYDYYSRFAYLVVVMACLFAPTFFVSDCQLFGRFASETVLPRLIIWIPMLLFMWLSKKVTSYKIMVPASYAVIHMIMWCTIWAIIYLPDKTHANEGFIIMHMLFFAMGFCAPFHYAVVAHVLVIVNILVSYQFNHYENMDIMLSLGIPCVVGICAIHYFMEHLYEDHYHTAKKLEYISMYDALTGVLNRNVWPRVIEEGTGRFAPSLGKEISVLMLDIDHFKYVNDTYGHIKGDVVLKELTRRVGIYIKEKDYIIRWGGEEFLVILTDTSLEKARALAEKMREDVARSDNGVCPITISIGVSKYKDSYKEALDAADHALYRAKNSGRNRVEVIGD